MYKQLLHINYYQNFWSQFLDMVKLHSHLYQYFQSREFMHKQLIHHIIQQQDLWYTNFLNKRLLHSLQYQNFWSKFLDKESLYILQYLDFFPHKMDLDKHHIHIIQKQYLWTNKLMDKELLHIQEYQYSRFQFLNKVHVHRYHQFIQSHKMGHMGLIHILQQQD